jgi:predicted RNA methylase
MSNFGYKMRTNRLTRPDGRVDVGILERKFAEKLKTEGAMSGRDLSVPFDYDRKFVLVDSEIGKEIDEGFSYLWDTKDKDGKSKYSDLLRVLNKRFDYLARLQLLEAIKAQEAIEQIKKHIALGRKVIVFHDYNEGGGSNPFVYVGGATQDEVGAVESQYEDFKRARPDLIALDLDLDAPITTLRRSFPDALLYNGRVAKGQRSKNADLFNSDNNGHNVLIAQSDAGATGISFHDTTGAHQRVIINIGMPSKPAKLRQTEGRIYRVGQASNAIQRYLTTGTDWERSTFSQKIAERAETVDNLAQGESAVVSIKDALVQAYEEAEYFEPSENDGIGGKAYDEENARINKLTPFERAKSDYWVKQKVTAKRQDREGKEWYATPEPVGLFMVNLSGAHSGDDILEPSAGDGAIGRYMPSDASVTFIEPSESLASRARMNNTNANVIVDSFESHGSNNKYDAIVMNPPFGNGGAIAIKHLVKAFEHLRIGGRVVALLPSGNMDKLIVDYSNKGYFAGIYQVAEFALPSSTFKNAGTAVNTKIYVFENHDNKSDVKTRFVSKDLSHYDDIEDLFNAIENINIDKRTPRIDEALAEYGLEIYPDRSKYIITGEGLKRKDITSRLFGSYIEKNKDGDVVEKYNRSIAYLKWLKDSQIPNMAQFNNGLSFNNLPIKYQGQVDKYNTWDGVGDMPVWLSVAMRVSDVELEHFAVEKPVYDAVGGIDPQAILAAMRQALDTPSDENIQALADVAGLSIKKPSPTDFNLSTYTESDLRAQESVLKAAEAKRQADEKAAKDKAFADRQVGDFRLSGSSMPSDVAASYGQNDMFVQTRGKLKDNFDDIGSFNFTPAIDFNQTLKAIKTALTDSSEGNIKRLAMLAGLTLKQAEPDIELDMFGEPINQDFDLFGEPIQDGEESPVEELPRLAVVELPLSKLSLSEDVPQFKSGADDESGVVEALGGKFDRTGVAPIQVWERTDGRLEIISGRHRTDLARRSGEKTIPAQVHKESEGFTAKQAMMLDAELNIRDGQGKVKDYVDYFTHSEISEDEADRRGLIARSIGQRAFTIASKGSEELLTLHRNDIISDQAAADIANIAPNNSAMQAVGLRVLQEHKPLNNALNTIRAVMALTREKGQEPDTFDLFGFDDSALKEAEAMAKVASRKQRQIAEQLNAIKGAVKNPKLAAKHGVVVENEADALAKVKTMTAQKARWDNWSSHADLLAEVRNEINNKLDSVFDEDDYYWLCQEELVA